MKWDCGPTWSEARSAKEAWHRWFAWRPVRVASHDCRWLEYVERRGYYYGDFWSYEYRALETNR